MLLSVPLALLAVVAIAGLAPFAGAIGGTAPWGWFFIEPGCVTAGVVLLFGWQPQRTAESQRTKAFASGLGVATLLIALGVLINTTVG